MTRLAVHRPSPEDQQAIGQLIHDQMLTTVAVLSASLNTTGVSIVMVALSQWVKELEEIDAPQAAILLHSLADLVDPENDDAAREDA
ncbi:MAG TPA: hypothetical protein DIT40_08885, partial [Alphaproteobacteria bacterium]|nr:hypothetical protein [Alphaproteobacteria bacterium]